MTAPEGGSEGKRRYVGRAPGWLDLMGDTGGYAGGMLVTATLGESVWATVELRGDRDLLLFYPQMRDRGLVDEVSFTLDDLESEDRVRQAVRATPGTSWAAYILGAFYLLKEWFPHRIVRGANVFLKSEAPAGKGPGSGAAAGVAAMKTLAAAFGTELSGMELAEACHWVDSTIAESTASVASQTACILGEEGRLLPVLCQDCVPRAPVRLPAPLRLWAVSSGAASGGGEPDMARAAAFMGYKLICDWEGITVRWDEQSPIPRWTDPRWNGYLANVKPSMFRSNYEERLPEALSGGEYLKNGQTHVDPLTLVAPELTYHVRACARFAVEENQRARIFLELARAGTGFEEMGELMYQSHFGYTECGLGCEQADQLVSMVCEEGPAAGLFGAKICGAGAVAVLGRKDAEPALRRVVRRFAKAFGEPAVFEGSSMGADRFGVLTLDS
jgi:L-arabinokinase